MTQVPPITIQYGLLQLPEGATNIKVTQWTIDFAIPGSTDKLTYNITLQKDGYYKVTIGDPDTSVYCNYADTFEQALEAINLHYREAIAILAECG